MSHNSHWNGLFFSYNRVIHTTASHFCFASLFVCCGSFYNVCLIFVVFLYPLILMCFILIWHWKKDGGWRRRVEGGVFFTICWIFVTSALSNRTFFCVITHEHSGSPLTNPIICTPACSSNNPIQQGTGSLALFKSNAPLTMDASGEDIFCRLSYESSRYQFPPTAKDRSVVPLVRSSDPLFFWARNLLSSL